MFQPTFPSALPSPACYHNAQVDEYSRLSAAGDLQQQQQGQQQRQLARSYELGPGCVLGSTDFYLARPHGTRAVCRSPVARVLRISRTGGAGRWALLGAARGRQCD